MGTSNEDHPRRSDREQQPETLLGLLGSEIRRIDAKERMSPRDRAHFRLLLIAVFSVLTFSCGTNEVEESIPWNARVLVDPETHLWRPDNADGREAARRSHAWSAGPTTYGDVAGDRDGYRLDPDFGGSDEDGSYGAYVGKRRRGWQEWFGLYDRRWNADGSWNY